MTSPDPHTPLLGFGLCSNGIVGLTGAARRDAEKNNWIFEKIPGDWSLLRNFVAGRRDPDNFLVVPPGHRVAASNDHLIVRAEKLPAGPPVDTDLARLPLEGH